MVENCSLKRNYITIQLLITMIWTGHFWHEFCWIQAEHGRKAREDLRIKSKKVCWIIWLNGSGFIFTTAIAWKWMEGWKHLDAVLLLQVSELLSSHQLVVNRISCFCFCCRKKCCCCYWIRMSGLKRRDSQPGIAGTAPSQILAKNIHLLGFVLFFALLYPQGHVFAKLCKKAEAWQKEEEEKEKEGKRRKIAAARLW